MRAHGMGVGLVAKLVWRVKLVAELEPGVVTETELAHIERDQRASLAELGLTLAEAKQLTAALQAESIQNRGVITPRLSLPYDHRWPA